MLGLAFAPTYYHPFETGDYALSDIFAPIHYLLDFEREFALLAQLYIRALGLYPSTALAILAEFALARYSEQHSPEQHQSKSHQLRLYFAEVG